MQDDLEALAERCEKATGPDRGIDEAVAELIEPGMFTRDQHGRLRKNLHGTVLTPQWDLWTPPAYTASLDAAMTLVPEGWTVLALNQRTAFEIAEAKATSVDPSETAEWLAALRHNSEHRSYRLVQSQLRHGYATTPALALCAAALRARASIGDHP